MKAEHLKEAQQIVDSIANIDLALTYKLMDTGSLPQLPVRTGPGSSTYQPITRDIAEKALALQHEAMRDRRAALMRRANQIGLVIGGANG